MENNDHEHPTHLLDPVCGMEIDSDSVEHVSVYEGREYFFCSRVCMEKSFWDKEIRTALKEKENSQDQ